MILAGYLGPEELDRLLKVLMEWHAGVADDYSRLMDGGYRCGGFRVSSRRGSDGTFDLRLSFWRGSVGAAEVTRIDCVLSRHQAEVIFGIAD